MTKFSEHFHFLRVFRTSILCTWLSIIIEHVEWIWQPGPDVGPKPSVHTTTATAATTPTATANALRGNCGTAQSQQPEV